MGKLVVILCEDNQAACLLRRFLRKGGQRFPREKIAPSGQGSGEQFVRRMYPSELEFCRRNRSKLIVCTDADALSLQERTQSLENACQREGIPPRAGQDQAALFIPKRNIETWLKFLTGNSEVDEDEDYSPHGSHRADKRICQAAAVEFYKYCRGQKPRPVSLPSLESACNEARRVI